MEQPTLRPLLGYLNFSSGAFDPRFARGLNEAFIEYDRGPQQLPAWRLLDQALRAELKSLSGRAPGFESIEQASAVLQLTFDRLLPAYRGFHRDLLAHHTDEALYRPYFLARALQAVLAAGPPFDEAERIIPAAITRLNDFIGYRPVAVLRTAQKIEPYPHEWVCPIPLYFAEAGVGIGRYHDLIVETLAVLRATPEAVLDDASFEPELLNELALDPRAYDFDHPANKRPNYHFGQWDPHTIDNAGRYRRFVLQAVTLDALLERVEQSAGDRQELLREAAVVLAGTMLMGAGVSGRGPEAHDSSVTLSHLLPRIAAYRDAFYRHWIEQIPGPHGERLKAEATALRQPFAGARHDLNQRLARLRAVQLQHVHLAQLFAAMGEPEASSRQAAVVPVASARMLSEISGRVSIGHLALERGDVAAAAGYFADIDDLLHRGVECGALVDPWNILGFGGQFPLFPALENSVRDHRVDVLIHLITRILGFGVHTAAAAAAAGAEQSLADVSARLRALAAWWDKFATLEVSSVDSVSGRESTDAAEAVAEALSAWRRAGATGGNIAFWREHVGHFDSPRAYAVVIETLLGRRDFVAAMGLLIAWLSESDRIALADQEGSFYRLAQHWMSDLFPPSHPPDAAAAPPAASSAAPSQVPTDSSTANDAARVALAGKFFDYLEANAGEYWGVPQLAWQAARPDPQRDTLDFDDLEDAEHDDEDDTFGAAYEGVTYLDTTDDGIEGAILSDGESATDYELELEAARLRARVAFLRMLARLRAAAVLRIAVPAQGDAADASASAAAAELAASQIAHAVTCEQGLALLLRAIDRDPIPKPSGAHTSLVEYDRRRRVKESLLAEVVAASVEARSAVRMLRAVMPPDDDETQNPAAEAAATTAGEAPSAAEEVARASAPRAGGARSWDSLSLPVIRGLLAREPAQARDAFPALRAALDRRPILFVPLARGGDPALLLEVQAIKQLIVELLAALARQGLIAETCRTITTAAAMERHRPAGEKAITEFDRLFEVGYRAAVEALVDSADQWSPRANADEAASTDAELIELLQSLTEPLMRRWLEHGQSVRLSALEKVADPARFKTLVSFIERYGHDLFTQRFLNLGSLRAILDQGTGEYLRLLEEDPATAGELRLLEELDRGITRAAAVEQLQTVIEAIIENYGEYKDFNTTTTQSDHGELLYMLLDFLRVKASYERVCWNIRPLILAHEILVRRGRHAAAELWRRGLAEQTREAADAHIAAAAAISERYGMRLPTINARLADRFIRPLAVDGLRALVEPAMAEIRAGAAGEAFARLEQEIEELAEQAVGAGIDVPPWLVALEEEAARARVHDVPHDPAEELARRLPPVALSADEIAHQLRDWESTEPPPDERG